METSVKTPLEVFFQPQQLMVPLFQRPYVWSQDGQWQPLWDDVQRLADRLLAGGNAAPHFLGAVVLQHVLQEAGHVQGRSVIDGQQRLTTLQLLLHAAYVEVSASGNPASAQMALDLVKNPLHFARDPEHQLKLVPTNRDRPAFQTAMRQEAGDALSGRSARIEQAHAFFRASIAAWLDGKETLQAGDALVEALSNLLQLVVIELKPHEDAQEIFETLNARGTPLTAADLIKNFVFQRMDLPGNAAEEVYKAEWQHFETPFWEKEVAAGRLTYSRSSLFLNQWLVASTQADIPAKEVFGYFKRYVSESTEPVQELLPHLRRTAESYRRFTEESWQDSGVQGPLARFVYRTSSLDSEVFKPVLIWLLDDRLSPVPEAQFAKALEVIESWLVRRACVRATTKGYNRLVVDVLAMLNRADRAQVGVVLEDYFARRTAESDYWPTDSDVREQLTGMPVYRRMTRARLRMILEAIEDHLRGFTSGRPLSEQPIRRYNATIEHVMPQEWRVHWRLSESGIPEDERDARVHTLGNLTLLVQALNSKVSNGAWQMKRESLEKHATTLMTRDVLSGADGDWNEAAIDARTQRMIDAILEVWRVPASVIGLKNAEQPSLAFSITVADLLRDGALEVAQTLYAKHSLHRHVIATLGADGAFFVSGSRYETPSAAAKAVTGSQSEAGWDFWLVSQSPDVSLADVRSEAAEAAGDEAVEGEPGAEDLALV
ncbi:DUF262 domain-containing protein [Sinomonas sp. ASV486]|uniref:GmrSD restriction endonuclease domain-containing protein n=1 Tax=Sinomonas sp. ASV486 TaxID=3051170 RepID=UPI0027DACC21|nr:DUF262 domain-containing protein [Sinomonas sp. ASV486]MDQ4489048.1 DUF262 domain-containing protein [Sinomonas sp. ASV486]